MARSARWARRISSMATPRASLFSAEKARRSLRNLPDWKLSADKKSIYTHYRMKDFMAAVHLISRMARLAEKRDHHPDIHLTGYRKLKIELSTHVLGGLSKKDFMLASQIDKLPKKLKSES